MTDADGRIMANLGPARLANHASLGRDGIVNAVYKSGTGRNQDGDTMLRIAPRRWSHRSRR
ncbi:hypothetical protein [Roseomonas haemaphysalidis]|uniref:Uncharacterized protein n=1 Tax=Roseomonas haemaphysalidis TaxID=2768162 RepID=A0ABS3KM86_9PROT|nr:hypothetical protein [Roseomonas haemaphysalidis]MBO1078080.1 hypothetical protein [Roseomonas haemaphysalidis]